MISEGRERESLPVPPIARAHVGVHTADHPSLSLAPSVSPGRLSEAACWQACPKCGRETFIAFTAGLRTRADAENLTIAAELAARIAGRLTYDILMYGIPRRMYLEYRDIIRIRAPRRHPVVAAHRCDKLVLLSAPVSNEMREIVIPYGKPLLDVPPF